MNTPLLNDGATPEPSKGRSSECMERWPHYWIWIWEDDPLHPGDTSKKIWTDFCKCTTCGAIKDSRTGVVVTPGAPKEEPPAPVETPVIPPTPPISDSGAVEEPTTQASSSSALP